MKHHRSGHCFCARFARQWCNLVPQPPTSGWGVINLVAPKIGANGNKLSRHNAMGENTKSRQSHRILNSVRQEEGNMNNPFCAHFVCTGNSIHGSENGRKIKTKTSPLKQLPGVSQKVKNFVPKHFLV